MTTAASIMAGQAWVWIHGKMGNLPAVLAKAQGQVSNFAGSVGQLGDQMGNKFGKAVMGGLVGFAAVGAIDNALRAVAERMRQAVANGETIGFEEVGMAIRESIVEGLKAVPVAGALGDILSLVFDPMLGGAMAQEEKLKQVEQQRKVLQTAFANLNEVAESMRRDGLSGPEQEALQLGDRVSAAVNSLVAAGVDPTSARQQAAALMDQINGIVASDAMSKLRSMHEVFQRMGGALSNDQMEARKFNEEISELTEMLRAGGFLEDAIDVMISDLWDARESALLMQEARERGKKIDDLIKGIEAESEAFGKSQGQLLEAELRKLGATQEQIDRALAAANDLEAKRKAAEEVSSPTTIESSIRAAGTFSSGAFDPRSGAAGSVVADGVRETARNTKRMVSILERNQLVYGT